MTSFPKILLASSSPRRKELLQKMDIEFYIRVTDVEEIIPAGYDPRFAPEYLAELKASAAQQQFKTSDLIIGADTIVYFNDQILGKPKTREEAIHTIQQLSGQQHEVISGVCLMNQDKKMTFSCTTQVHFKNINSDDIAHYVDNYQVMDKAGSYGIQDWIGNTQIEKIDGSYTNIMGLPTTMLYYKLREFCVEL